MGDDSYIAQDVHYYFYPQGMTKRDKFIEYVLPWLIFIGLMVGVFYMFTYGLYFIVEISRPLSEGMKAVGL